MSDKKLKVLVKAHELNTKGSEALHAYNLLLELSNLVELTVIHSEGNQFGDVSYRFDKSQFHENTQFYSMPYETFAKPIIFINKRFRFLNRSIGFAPIYFLALRFWEYSTYKFIKSLNVNFDIIHSLNHISYREPGYLYRLKGQHKYIHGPISGFYNVPYSMFKTFNWMNLFRTYFNSLKISKRLKDCLAGAACYLFVNEYDRIIDTNSMQFPDVGINKVNKSIPYVNSKDVSKLDIVVIGRVEVLKGSDILIDTFTNNVVLQEKFRVHFFGHIDESVRNALPFCKFHGHVANSDIQSHLQKSHLLIHLSLKEATSLSIVEALNNQCNVVCHAGFGIDSYLNDNICTIPLVSHNYSVLILIKFLSDYRYRFFNNDSINRLDYKILALKLHNLYVSNT